MKKLLFILFSIFFCIQVGAQSISVASFSLLENDLTANTAGTTVLDQNGERCALIKVETTQTGFNFDVGTLGVVRTEQHTAEIWVYVPAGVKRISIAHQQLGRLNDYDLGMTLQKSKTYRLKLVTGQVETIVHEAKVKTGWLVIDSQPSGASVYLNDEYVGNTPLDNYKTEYGSYRYRLELGNYHNASGIVELNSPREEQTITLKPAFGSIRVNSSVGGAQVLLDGQNTGKTSPCTLDVVASGRHTIVVQLQRYTTAQQTIDVKDGETTAVEAVLQPRFAMVSIESVDGAQISIDGRQVGTTSYRGELLEGYHDIEVSKAHHRNVEKQVKVEASLDQSIHLEPSPIYGSLDVVSSPRNAAITIDGKLYGLTPNTVEQLLEGAHSVELTLAGHNPDRVEVSIEEGKTATISRTLRADGSAAPKPIARQNKEQQGGQPLNNDMSVASHQRETNRTAIHFYMGGAYQVLSTSGVALSLGGNIGGFVIEAGAMLGLNASEPIYCNGVAADPWAYTYKPMTLKASLGGMIPIGETCSITPQVGIGLCRLSGSVSHYGDGTDPQLTTAVAIPLSLAARFDYRIVSHFGLSVVPEYSFPVSQGDTFRALSDASADIKSMANGFNLRVGLNVYF